MDPSILNSPVTTIGVIALVLIAVVTGMLVPGRTVKMLLNSKDQEIAMWKQIAHDREGMSHTALSYAQDSLDVNRTAVKALDALAQVADQGDARASTTAS